MRDTSDLRDKILSLWQRFENGKLTGTEARTHIGFARTVLEAVKVEIAAAHLDQINIPAVTINGMSTRMLGSKKRYRKHSSESESRQSL